MARNYQQLSDGDRSACCSKCGHDLYARKSGKVFCSNKRCTFHRSAHPTGKKVNR